ncbi:unnamed protein product [Calypogeia fissa]
MNGCAESSMIGSPKNAITSSSAGIDSTRSNVRLVKCMRLHQLMCPSHIEIHRSAHDCILALLWRLKPTSTMDHVTGFKRLSFTGSGDEKMKDALDILMDFSSRLFFLFTCKG